MKIFAPLFISVIFVSSIVQASPMPDASVERLIEICADTASPASSKSDAASELTFRDPIKLDDPQLKIALSCLQTEFGAEFTYNGFSLFSPALDAAAAEENRSLRAANQMLTDTRKEVFFRELSLVCYAELKVDRFRAMTSEACARIFINEGLPQE